MSWIDFRRPLKRIWFPEQIVASRDVKRCKIEGLFQHSSPHGTHSGSTAKLQHSWSNPSRTQWNRSLYVYGLCIELAIVYLPTLITRGRGLKLSLRTFRLRGCLLYILDPNQGILIWSLVEEEQYENDRCKIWANWNVDQSNTWDIDVRRLLRTLKHHLV